MKVILVQSELLCSLYRAKVLKKPRRGLELRIQMKCSHCGAVCYGPKHESDPNGERTMPKGWSTQYINFNFSIHGCSSTCFEAAKIQHQERQCKGKRISSNLLENE